MPTVSEFQLGIDGKAYIEKDDGTNTMQDLTKVSSDIESKFRSAIQGSKFKNAVDSTPWVKSPSWVASTVYYAGQVVVGLDGVNCYICATGGTSAGSGGPTGSGYGPITDGGVTWHWYSRQRGDLNYTAIAQFGALATLLTNIPSYRSFVPTMSSPIVSWFGGVMELNPNAGPMVDIRGPNASVLGTDPAQPGAFFNTAVSGKIQFMTDSRKIVLASINAVFAGAGGVTVEINGKRVQEGVIVPSSTLNPGGLLIDTTTLDLPVGMFFVTIRSNAGFSLVARTIYIEPGATIVPVTSPLKIAVEGDSLTQGGNGTPYAPGKDWVSQVFERIGIPNACNMAVGGTGFISNNGNAKTNHIQRIERFTSLNADVYILAGNHNDDTYTSAERKAAVLNYLKSLRQRQPDSMIIVFGNTTLRDDATGVGSNQYNAELDLKAAVTEFRDPNTYFIPILTSTSGSWTTGTGNISSPANDGNKDRFYSSGDGHPIQRGQDYFASRYYAELVKFFENL